MGWDSEEGERWDGTVREGPQQARTPPAAVALKVCLTCFNTRQSKVSPQSKFFATLQQKTLIITRMCVYAHMRVYACLTGNAFMVQMSAFFSGAYLALPVVTWTGGSHSSSQWVCGGHVSHTTGACQRHCTPHPELW